MRHDYSLLAIMAATIKANKSDHTAKTAVNVAEEILEELDKREAEAEAQEIADREAKEAPPEPAKDDGDKGKTKGDKAK